MKKQVSIYLIGPKKKSKVKSRESVKWFCETGYKDIPKDLGIILAPGGSGSGFERLLENKDHKYHDFYQLVAPGAANAKLAAFHLELMRRWLFPRSWAGQTSPDKSN